MLATLTSKGQMTLPKEIREKLGLKAIEAGLRVVAGRYRKATPGQPDRPFDHGDAERTGATAGFHRGDG